jgi:acetyl esterase/lipase
MMLLSIAVIFLCARKALAQELPAYIERPSDAAGVFAIWPSNGLPPGSEKWTWHEQTMQAPGSTERMVRNIVIPTVTMFNATNGKTNGTAVIVALGGAFHFLMVDHEGYDMARRLTKLGVTALVLKYRVAHMPETDADVPPFLNKLFTVLPHPGPTAETPPVGTKEVEEARTWAEEDGRQAIRFVRHHAKDWGIDPNRIGIAGFSAGGGVVMEAVMQHDAQSRPDFGIPIYAGYRNATPVPSDAPPLFIAATDDDVLVAPISGARLYEAWHAAGKPAELHIFIKGARFRHEEAESAIGLLVRASQELVGKSWVSSMTNRF